jgi:hypothetical protein
MPIKFFANHNTIIFGQTGAGKTHFILNVIKQKLVHPFPEIVYYMYNVEQDFMKSWNETNTTPIIFIKGLDFESMDTSKPSMLVIDDLILSTNKDVAELFILGSHHKQISLFFLTQNLFPNCPIFRTMSANAHYYVIFHCQRHFRQVHTLFRQIFGGKDLKRTTNAYIRAGDKPRGFIVLSFSPLLPKQLTVVTDWWEVWPSLYL